MKTLSRVLLLSAICFVMAFSTTSCEKELADNCYVMMFNGWLLGVSPEGWTVKSR